MFDILALETILKIVGICFFDWQSELSYFLAVDQPVKPLQATIQESPRGLEGELVRVWWSKLTVSQDTKIQIKMLLFSIQDVKGSIMFFCLFTDLKHQKHYWGVMGEAKSFRFLDEIGGSNTAASSAYWSLLACPSNETRLNPIYEI